MDIQAGLLFACNKIRFSHNTVRPLYNAIFGVHRKGPHYKISCYEGTILLRNYWEMMISWSISYNSFGKFHVKKNWEPQCNMTVLYPNLCYNEVHYKETALYLSHFGAAMVNRAHLLSCSIQMSRHMRFPTMWHLDKCRLRQACAVSF